MGYEEKLNQTIEIEYEDYASGEIVIKDFIVTGITQSSESAQVKNHTQ